MTAPTYAYSALVAPARGLDPSRYRVTVLVQRTDDKPLTAADLRAAEAAYPQPAPRRKTAPKRAAARMGAVKRTT
jgi:hypothetical protein